MFLSVFITGSLIEFANVGSGLIDGIITSRMLGSNSMAAEGIVHSVFSILGVISGLFTVGMQAMNGVSLARGNIKEMQQRFSLVVLLSSIISVVSATVLFVFAEPIAAGLGAKGNAAELLGESASYLKGISFGSIPLILYAVFASAIQMENGSRLVQVSALIGSAADIILDIAAVRLGLGLWGMGLATSLSSYVSLVILLTFFLKKERILKFDFSVMPWKDIRDVFSLGSVKVFRRMANVIRPVCLNMFIISAGGALGMSALSIKNNFSNFLEIPMTGIASATAMLTSITYGEENKEDCMRVTKLAHRYIWAYAAIAAIATGVFVSPCAAIYVQEPGELRNLVIFAIFVSAFDIAAASLLESRTNYLQSSAHTKKSQILTLMVKLFAIIPIAFICVHLWGSRGVIASFAISDIVVCLGIFVLYTFRLRGKRLPNAEDYMDLPDSFDILPQNIIEVKVQNAEEVALTSEQVQLFCNGHRLDPAKAYKASLCLEEVLSNIIEHGFKADKKNQPIDVRITISNGNLIMRVRDFCPRFDLVKRIEQIHNDDDPLSNIGIRLIEKEALDIKYVNLVDSNTLIITV